MADTDRPSMKQDDHPDHNMPESEHDGSILKDLREYAKEAKDDLDDRMNQGAKDKSWATDPTNWRNK